MRSAGPVARMRKRRCVYRVLVGKLKVKDHLEDLAVDVRIIKRWIFSNWDVKYTDWIDLAQNRDR